MAEKTYKFVCTVCGYEVEVDTPELLRTMFAQFVALVLRCLSSSRSKLPTNELDRLSMQDCILVTSLELPKQNRKSDVGFNLHRFLYTSM